MDPFILFHEYALLHQKSQIEIRLTVAYETCVVNSKTDVSIAMAARWQTTWRPVVT